MDVAILWEEEEQTFQISTQVGGYLPFLGDFASLELLKIVYFGVLSCQMVIVISPSVHKPSNNESCVFPMIDY